MNRFSTTASSKQKTAFQNHAQTALNISAIDKSVDISFVSA